ncbi:E3 ubiquitin-protein ligase RNF31-like [Gastrophryne carolinensis]
MGVLWGPVARLRANLNIKQIIYNELSDENEGRWSLEDIEEAVSMCPDYSSALRYLSHECPLCCNQYKYSKFVMMTHCNCTVCDQCFISYFSSVIKEKSIIHATCPICKKPDLEKDGNSEQYMEFFNLLDTQIHHYLDQEMHELFQRKLRDQALMEMPNFSWCSHCPFGVLHEGETLKMECPTCNKSTCFNCKQQWEDIHEDMSCEEFRQWKLQHQEEELDEYLLQNGTECPSCKFQYELWKGGCLHFKCTQCQFEFCGGCRQPFYQGQDCDFSEECHGKGLHAHHIRDCYYYLRDWDVERLQQLLQINGIEYRGDITPEPSNMSLVILELHNSVQKSQDEDNTHNMADSNSNDMDEREFLVKIINANSLDPVDLYTEEEMKLELQRWGFVVSDYNGDDDSKETYLHLLKMEIRKEAPLSTYLD